MKNKKMKLIALFFVVLMFGSTLTYLVSIFTANNAGTQIPQDKILNYALNDQQKQYLISKGFTLIEYSYPTGCLECIDVKKNLEKITQISDNQIYLQEITANGEVAKLSIVSYNGGKTLNNPMNQEAETSICGLLLKKSIWCVSSKV